MLNSKIRSLQLYFGITKPEDWCDVEPAWIIAQDGIGKQTLDYIRMLLAARNLTLKDDRTPEFWRENLAGVKIVDQLGLGDESDSAIATPFAIFIDTQEQAPFTFAGIRSSSKHNNRTWLPRIEWRALGRHPDSLGDYSVEGGVGYCHVERKSREDLHSTLLDFGGRRERFESELELLSRIPCGCVVVECSFETAISDVVQHGSKPLSQLRKTIYGSITALMQDYRCRWQFCDSRRLAEHFTFSWLERYWRKNAERSKSLETLIAEI